MKDILSDLTFQIRGAIYDVYNNLGPGLLESVYQGALAYELKKRGLIIEEQREIPIIYDGARLFSNLRIDMLVENSVIIELKSVTSLEAVHYKQINTYLRLSGLRAGILVNFNTANIVLSTRTIDSDWLTPKIK